MPTRSAHWRGLGQKSRQWPFVRSLVSRARGAIDAFGNAYDHQGQFEQNPQNQNAHKVAHDSCDKIDQSLCRGDLEAQNHTSHYSNSTGENPNDIENLDNAAYQLLLKREVEEPRKEVLIVGHVACWRDFDDGPANR